MNESGKKKSDGLFIAGGIALIAVLVIAIKLIFAWLGAAVPPERLNPDLAQSQGVTEQIETDTPVFCPFCGETLHDSFRWGQFCPWCGEKIERCYEKAEVIAMRPEHKPHQEGRPVYGPNWVTVGRCTLSAQQWAGCGCLLLPGLRETGILPGRKGPGQAGGRTVHSPGKMFQVRRPL